MNLNVNISLGTGTPHYLLLIFTANTADFIKKGTRSVHLFNRDYLSIPEGTGSCRYLFYEIPGILNMILIYIQMLLFDDFMLV